MNFEENMIVTLTDEDDVDQDFLVASIFDYSGQKYAILLPVDENDQPLHEPYLFALDEHDGETELADISDGEEYEEVVAYYKKEVEGK